MKQSGEIPVNPELQNSHFSQQRKFFFFCNGSGSGSESESERRGGARVHIQTLLSINSGNQLLLPLHNCLIIMST